MTVRVGRSIEKHTPRWLGAAFLLQAIASVIGTFLLTPLIVPGDIVQSMTNIASKTLQLRSSIVCEMIAVIGIVMLGVLLYATLKQQNRKYAQVALGLYVLTAAIIAVSRVAAFALLRVSQESVAAGHPDYLQTLGSLFYELQDFGYFLHMMPYTFGATTFYYLFYRSRLLPPALIIFGLIAIAVAFAGSVVELFGFQVPLFVFVPNLPFDLGVGLWLLFMGTRPNPEPQQA